MTNRDDVRFMRRALAAGRRGLGRTSPNPAVGAVVVRDGKIVGTGFHQCAGGPHAEVHALRAAGELARGATIYVTLEPCNHHGRTPPCSEAVLAAGIRRVVIGSRDPNPKVEGNGAERLRRAGLSVVEGVLENDCDALIAGFRKHITTGLPWVTLKLAASLDGRIATASGDSRWITNEKSRRYVHQLRAEHDAILVGANTVIADDPELTCRLPGRPSPRRVVLDAKLRVPLSAKAFRVAATTDEGRAANANAAPILVTSSDAPMAKVERFRRAGVDVIRLAARDGSIPMAAVLRQLGKRGLMSLLVEGGGTVAAAALRAGTVDELQLFVAPKLIGGDGRPVLAGLGISRMAKALVLEAPRLRRFGEDLLVTARPKPGGR